MPSLLTTRFSGVTLCDRFAEPIRGSEATKEEEGMGGFRTAIAVIFLSAAALIAGASALAATPQEIYRDYADNGKLDGQYSPADLERVLKNAAVQQYGGGSTGGLPPAVEGGGNGGSSGGVAGGSSGGTSGGSSGGGSAGASSSGGAAGGQTAGGGVANANAQSSSGGLPFTGLDLSLIIAGALGLILLGTLMRRVARQRA